MKFRIATLICAFLLLAAAPVFAGSISVNNTCNTGCSSQSTTINFNSPTGKLGVSQSYGSPSVTAYGYLCHASTRTSTSLTSCVAAKLNGRNNGANEEGLGLYGENSGQNEIGWDNSTHDYVLGLDVSNLYKLGVKSLTLSFSSVQMGENYTVWGYGSNPFGSSATLSNMLVSYTGTSNSNAVHDSTITLNNKDEFLVVTAKSGNVLLGSACYTAPSSPTPEPGTMALLGTGLLMIGYGLRRKLNASPATSGK